MKWTVETLYAAVSDHDAITLATARFPGDAGDGWMDCIRKACEDVLSGDQELYDLDKWDDAFKGDWGAPIPMMSLEDDRLADALAVKLASGRHDYVEHRYYRAISRDRAIAACRAMLKAEAACVPSSSLGSMWIKTTAGDYVNAEMFADSWARHHHGEDPFDPYAALRGAENI